MNSRGLGADLRSAAVTVGALVISGWSALFGRELPPTVPQPKPVVLPAPAIRVLPNGLKVVVIERHSLPMLTLRLVVTAGAEADPAELPGTAQLVAGLLNQGTKRRSAQQIAEAIDFVGGTIEAGADWDRSFALVTVLTDHTELAFDLLADMVSQPAFEPAEIERKRQETHSALELMRDDPAYLADTAFRSIVFSGTPYGHPPDGTLEAVRQVTSQQLKEFHSRYYRPSNSILAIVGDGATGKMFELAERFFAQWEESGRSYSPPVTNPGSGPRRVIVIDKPDAVQTEIRIGNFGIRRDAPDYYALTVANQILGGPATNRLFKSLRAQRGLTYGASSDLLCYRTLGSWVAKTFTRTPETMKTVQTVLEEMNRLRSRPITEQELETAEGYLSGHLALEFESSEGIATNVLDLMLHNLPLDYWNRFPERVRALKTEDVSSAIRRYLDPERNVIVLVGNVAGFGGDLNKLGPTRVIPLRSLDFGSAGLDQTTGATGNR